MRTNDEFWAIVADHIGPIQWVYHQYFDEKPVIQLELPTERISAYSQTEFLKTLSPRSKKILKRDYALATAKGQIVVFIRDNESQTLESSRIEIEPIEWYEGVGEQMKCVLTTRVPKARRKGIR